MAKKRDPAEVAAAKAQAEAKDAAYAITRARVPLRLRDLAAAAAFGSMAVSGSIPVWATALFGAGLLLALWGKRPLAERGTIAAVLLVGVAVVLYSQVATGGLDLVIAACTLAGLITLHRMVSTPTRRTDGQVHLTSLLMIAGGAALSGDLLFGAFLALYASLASLSVGLSVVESALPPGEPLPYRPALRQLSLGSIFAVLGAVTFFVVFPRLSWNLAAKRTGPGLGGAPITGFGDRIRLSGDGSIKTNPRVVLRATISPEPKADDLDAYWVGRTFDTFDGHEWVGHATPQPKGAYVAVRDGGRAGRLVQQRIELLPAYGANTAIALDSPVRFANAMGKGPNGNVPTSMSVLEGEEVRLDLKSLGYTYQAFSLPPRIQVPDERSWAQRERYLQLPEKLDPRVATLAKQVVGNQTDPLRIARRLETYLKREYRYSLELSQSDDPLVSFLFERREGHCEHFASALVILLRSSGVPARAASGFYGGQRVGHFFVVRAGDAHAWAQVLTEDAGFVTIDATPEGGRGAQPTPLFGWVVTQYELLENFWRQKVVDYTFWDQIDLARSLVRPPQDSGNSDTRVSSDWRPSRRTWVMLGAFAVTYFVLTRGRRTARSREKATVFAEKAEALLRKEVVILPGEDLETVASRLERERHPLAAPLRVAVDRYLRARFGGQPFAPQEPADLLRSLRSASADQRRAA
ncbi:MAG: transglutaminase TgpA family protein [Myxococcaceae bacterium]